MNKKLKIIYASCTSNKQSASKLLYVGDVQSRIHMFNKKLIENESPDIIAYSELTYEAMTILQKHNINYGYKMYVHHELYDVKHTGKYTCLCAMFVKDSLNIEQTYSPVEYNFKTIFRYTQAKVNFNDSELILRMDHIPQCDKDNSAQIQRKRNQLNNLNHFVRTNYAYNTLCFGDYNGELFNNEEYYCSKELSLLLEMGYKDFIVEPTFSNRILDHVLVSTPLLDSNEIKVSVKVISEPYYLVYTDHRPIVIIIES